MSEPAFSAPTPGAEDSVESPAGSVEDLGDRQERAPIGRLFLEKGLVSQNEMPLGFAFGYHWQKEDGLLMLATREALPALPAEEQPQKVRVRK